MTISVKNYREAAKFMLSKPGPIAMVVVFFVAMYGRASAEGFLIYELLCIALLTCFRGVIEWGIHVYILHGHPLPIINKRILTPAVHMHHRHHCNPDDPDGVFFGPIAITASSALVFFAGWLIFPWPGVAYSLVLAFLLMNFIHEWSHMIAHSSIMPSSDWFREAIIGHRLHHELRLDAGYGASSRLGDKLFGAS